MHFGRKNQVEANAEVTNQTGERASTSRREIAITGNLRLFQLLVAGILVCLAFPFVQYRIAGTTTEKISGIKFLLTFSEYADMIFSPVFSIMVYALLLISTFFLVILIVVTLFIRKQESSVNYLFLSIVNSDWPLMPVTIILSFFIDTGIVPAIGYVVIAVIKIILFCVLRNDLNCLNQLNASFRRKNTTLSK